MSAGPDKAPFPGAQSHAQRSIADAAWTFPHSPGESITVPVVLEQQRRSLCRAYAERLWSVSNSYASVCIFR
jgi:hypothetical protein